ncbi:MAG: hypothetical protein ACRD96_08305, partial [Bryobacteraceae bacterium]
TFSKGLLAPRIGLAYRLGNDTVIRAGYGITYDPYPLSRPLRAPFPAVIVDEYFGANSFDPAGSLATGIPQVRFPDISSGVVRIPNSVSTVTLPAGEFRRGYIQSFNFTVQRQIFGGFTAQAGYVGTRSIRQALTNFNINAGVIPGAGQLGQPLFSKFPGRNTATNVFLPFATNNYNSLQTQLTRRFSGGLFANASYTWSKTMGINAGNSDNGLTIYIPSQMHRNRAVTDFDRTHVFASAVSYQLPFGKGKQYLNNGFAGAVAGNWQINAGLSAASGGPFSVTASSASLNAPANTQYADQVKDSVQTLHGHGRGEPYFDGSSYRAVTDARIGTSARNGLRGPGAGNIDLSVFRVFPITERYQIEFRAESYNFTNTPHFANPTGDVSSSNYTFITGTAEQDQRQFRFALRFSF